MVNEQHAKGQQQDRDGEGPVEEDAVVPGGDEQGPRNRPTSMEGEMSDDTWLEDLLTRCSAAEETALNEARELATEEGKEPFHLETMYRLWPWCPDLQLSDEARAQMRIQLEHEWSKVYYLQCADLHTMEAFAFQMRELQRTGHLDG